ncbi:MAG TPA: DUF998 domain-containing protein [Polyangia bacterium]
MRAHRNAIGLLGFWLPAAVYLLAAARDTTGLERWEVLSSVSAYHHTGAGPLFAGVLFAIGLFLVTYRGYVEDAADRRVGKVAGVAAFLVAIFPTRAPAPVLPPTWWRPLTGIIHYSAAVVLFGCFILFSVWLFQRSDQPDRARRPPMKRLRDRICMACGISMIGAMVWAGVRARAGQSIFCPEATAIFAFGVSWLVKAEFFGLLSDRWGDRPNPASALAGDATA